MSFPIDFLSEDKDIIFYLCGSDPEEKEEKQEGDEQDFLLGNINEEVRE